MARYRSISSATFGDSRTSFAAAPRGYLSEHLPHSAVPIAELQGAWEWKQHLKSHFAGRTLRGYRTHMGSQLLTELAKRLGRRTVANTKNLMSAIFTHAVNVGLIETNVCHDMKPLVRTNRQSRGAPAGACRSPATRTPYTPACSKE